MEFSGFSGKLSINIEGMWSLVVFWQTSNKYRGIVEFSGFSGKLSINIEGLWSLVVFWQTFNKYQLVHLYPVLFSWHWHEAIRKHSIDHRDNFKILGWALISQICIIIISFNTQLLLTISS